MFWNHPTLTEESERPEGDLNFLASELVSDARYQASGPAGPGLYAEAKVFEAYKGAINDLAPHIGVSIRARGKAQNGSIEGREGPIITELTAAKSVDYVTQPGAGGQVLSLFEAARGNPRPLKEISNAAGRGDAGNQNPNQEVKNMPENLNEQANATLKAELEQQRATVARLSEALVLREAGDFARDELAKVQLPEVTKARLLQQLAKVAPIKEGRIDTAAFAMQIAEAVKSEQAYLAEAVGAGRIAGLGASAPVEQKPEQMEAEMEESFRRIGLSESAAKAAAKGR
jgi:hypothetical protein